MNNDNISNNQMDRAVEMAEADTQHALTNSANNEPSYVSERFFALHVSFRRHLENPADRDSLIPLPAPKYKTEKYKIQAGPNRKGITAILEVNNTGERKRFHIESNGRNGVKVTGPA